VVDPVAVMRALPDAGWPRLGLMAVVTRFTVQDLVQTLPLALLGRRPFIPAKLPVRPEHHYRAQLVFLPAVGIGLWLLMGGTAHALLRLTGERSDLGRVLDVIGVAMVIPMPPLWVCDMALIAADRFRLPELAVVNPAVQLWETALFGIGLRTALGVSWRHAMPAGLAASVVYVLGASRFLR
jgi:Yip1-like protein